MLQAFLADVAVLSQKEASWVQCPEAEYQGAATQRGKYTIIIVLTTFENYISSIRIPVRSCTWTWSSIRLKWRELFQCCLCTWPGSAPSAMWFFQDLVG